jgi:hypothetical protein
MSSLNTTNYVGVISPGFNVKPQAYTNITKTIISQAESMSIGIDMFIANVTMPTQSNYNHALNEIFNYIHDAYDPTTEIFFVGHSAGAFFGLEHSIKYSNYTIQIGSVLNSAGKLFWDKGNLLSYPRPIMTLLGENDGFLPWTMGTHEMAIINDFINEFGYQYISKWKPILILEGVNHMAAADNKLTESAKAYNKTDMECAQSLEQTHMILSDYIIDFITKNTDRIVVQLDKTRKKLKIYSKISDENFISEKINYLQNLMLNNVFKIYNIFHSDFDNFIYSKPHITDLGVVTQSFVDVFIPINTEGVVTQSYINYTNTYNFSDHLWLKMKRGSIIVNASVINSYIFDGMYKKLTKNQKNRYKKYGKKIFFGEDIYSKNWITDKLSITYNSENITISSPVLLTDSNISSRYANMYYVKVLTPAQIYNWLTVKSFL